MFVALSRFTIRNNMDEQVRQAFVDRPHLVDSVPGFVGMQVMSPMENPAEIWLVTRWSDKASFHRWHKSHAHHLSHAGIPKGLKLVAGSNEIRYFNLFAE